MEPVKSGSAASLLEGASLVLGWHVGPGGGLSQAPRGQSNGPGQEKGWGRAEVSHTHSVSDNYSYTG